MNTEALKQWAITALVPVLTGTLVTWLVGNKVIAAVGITHNVAIAGINQVLVFGVTAGIAFLASHHVLAGHYTPEAKAKAGKP